jgi:pSer/pThr/pTyr-binding forkhead associated (FHA) protein
MNPVLIARGGSTDGRRVELTSEVVIGREGTDIVLDDPRVSRRHAIVRRTPSGVVIEDLGSTNGTFVDGTRIASPAAVTSASTVTIGGTTFRLEHAAAEPGSGDRTAVGASPAATVVGISAPAPSPSPPPALRPAVPLASAPPPQFSPVPDDPPGIGGVATRRWLPTAITIGVIVLTSILLLVYFVVR